MMSRWGYFRTSLSSSCWLSHIHNNNRHLSQGYNSSSSADYTQVFDGPVIESAVSLLSWEYTSFISCYWFVLLGHCIRLPHSGFFFDCICTTWFLIEENWMVFCLVWFCGTSYSRTRCRENNGNNSWPWISETPSQELNELETKKNFLSECDKITVDVRFVIIYPPDISPYPFDNK